MSSSTSLLLDWQCDDVCGVLTACRWPLRMREVSIEMRNTFDSMCPRNCKLFYRSTGIRELYYRIVYRPWDCAQRWMGNCAVANGFGQNYQYQSGNSAIGSGPGKSDFIVSQNMDAIADAHSVKLTCFDAAHIMPRLVQSSTVHTLCLHHIYDGSGSGSGSGSDICIFANVDALRNVHTLTLCAIPFLTDVSALGGVHTLTLYDLWGGVTDVSALGSVHTLTLCRIRGVTDVSALGGVHTLTLRQLKSVTDVSALGGVHTLTLCRLYGVTDVSALGSVHTLILERLNGVTDVSALGNVHTLTLHDVSALENTHTPPKSTRKSDLDAERRAHLRSLLSIDPR